VKRTFLIINANSGNAQAVSELELAQSLRAAGLDIIKRLDVANDDLPDRETVESADADVVVTLSGDGTISGVCEKLAGWQGSVLVLPGGTMNLLSRRLHGDIDLAELLAKLPDAELTVAPVSVVCVQGREILTGLTAGPSTRWGEVREGIRQGDMASLAEIVPSAWSETLAKDGVWIDGNTRETYAGIFVEPVDAQTLSVIAFRANNLGDMVGHGIAWLRRDFREGPRDDLGNMPAVTIMGDDPTTGLLIDGEVDESPLPLTCTAGMSSVQFLRLDE
jgi:hypothetical protein